MAKAPTKAEMEKIHANPMPKQLQDQVAAVEALINPPAGEPGEPAGGELPAQDLQPTNPTNNDGLIQPPGAPKVPAAPPAPAPAAAAAPEDTGQTWEQRYNSLRGRLDATNKTNGQLVSRLEEMERMIALMSASGTTPPGEPAAPTPPARLVTAEEEQDFGPDLLNVVGKRSRDELAPELSALQARLNQLEGRVEGTSKVVQQDLQQNMYARLTADVPNWRDINRWQEFHDWLSVPDPFSGTVRHQMLKDAFARHETNRVLSFFKGFLAEAPGLPQTPSGQVPGAPQNNGSGRPSLEDFAAPGRARSGPEPITPDKPVYTHADIAKFYHDKLQGKYKGREADVDLIERDIFAAQSEGRIQ